MKQVLEKLKDLSISEGSAKTYAQSYLRIKKNTPSLSVNNVKKYLDTLSPVTARNLLTGLVAVTQRADLRTLVDRYKQEAEAQLDRQQLSEREKQNYLSASQIRKLERRLREDVASLRIYERTSASDRELRLAISG